MTGGHQRAFAERIGMTESSVSYWMSVDSPTGLLPLLRICRAAAFPLRAVLLGDLDGLRTTTAHVVRVFVMPSQETHRVLDRSGIEGILERSLATEPPPTLASLVREHRLDRAWLRRHHPCLCKRIVDRHEAYRRDCVEARRSTRRDLIQSAVMD